jgi:allophanate hydrolase
MKTDTSSSSISLQVAKLDQLSDLASYQAAYASGIDPAQVLRDLYSRIEKTGKKPVWISLLPLDVALATLLEAQRRKEKGEVLPLFGIPFGVKDNIDVAGLPTTAGCAEYAYTPERHAFVVEKLVAAGAIPIGKTNLDQFATGLNGTRSPYGIPRCTFDEKYVSGGSSSGSAVAVANGMVAFSLGTDTAGSGRVPASFNNLVGLKPTKGLFSNSGLVRAARSLDCISVFANSVDDALTVTRIAAGYDAEDAFSRQAPEPTLTERDWPARFKFGVPAAEHLQFFGDNEAKALFDVAIRRLEEMGGERITFDYTPFKQTAELLYAGPWVAERLAAIQAFANEQPEAIHPVVRDIIFSAQGMSAVDAFNGQYQLAEYVRAAESTWRQIDVMLLPTAPTIYTVDDMLADPVRLNSNLGLYTNFVNLMDLSAIAIPAGFRTNGLPFGVSLIGRAFEDGAIASLGKAFIDEEARKIAHINSPVPQKTTVAIAVVGAHLSGQPLNYQLTEREGKLRSTARTARGYALYALGDSIPAKPGMIRDRDAAGNIEVEIWELPVEGFGSFVNEIPAPLGIGTITLEDGSQVKGFLCEAYAVETARDITHYGGWRAYRADQ